MKSEKIVLNDDILFGVLPSDESNIDNPLIRTAAIFGKI